MILRLTKCFTFDMAHALPGYDGKCRNIHGHTYKLEITVQGSMNLSADDPKHGMVIDFGDIKGIVQQNVVDMLDHALMLPRHSPYSVTGDTKLVTVDFQPTIENILIYIADILSSRMPQGVSLYSVRLHETDTSYGELFV